MTLTAVLLVDYLPAQINHRHPISYFTACTPIRYTPHVNCSCKPGNLQSRMTLAASNSKKGRVLPAQARPRLHYTGEGFAFDSDFNPHQGLCTAGSKFSGIHKNSKGLWKSPVSKHLQLPGNFLLTFFLPSNSRHSRSVIIMTIACQK